MKIPLNSFSNLIHTFHTQAKNQLLAPPTQILRSTYQVYISEITSTKPCGANKNQMEVLLSHLQTCTDFANSNRVQASKLPILSLHNVLILAFIALNFWHFISIDTVFKNNQLFLILSLERPHQLELKLFKEPRTLVLKQLHLSSCTTYAE